VFELDDNGTASVVIEQVPPPLIDSVTEAADRCPTGAIFLELDPNRGG
jgi:ferredoxin